MTITSIKMVSPTIHGSMLTDRARETMGAGDWKGALAFLVDSLEGMSYDQAISIIEGRMRLTGEGATVNMEAEDPLVMERLQEQYKAEYALGQYVRHDSTMYEPYRVIDNLGPEDANCVLALPEFQAGNLLSFNRYPEWMSDMDTVHVKSCYQVILPSKALEQGIHASECGQP
jgi:hypothetical protein